MPRDRLHGDAFLDDGDPSRLRFAKHFVDAQIIFDFRNVIASYVRFQLRHRRQLYTEYVLSRWSVRQTMSLLSASQPSVSFLLALKIT